MTDDDGHYETKKSNISRGRGLGGGAHQKSLVNLGGILRIFLCNFKEVLGGKASPETFCEFRGVFEDFCIRFLIVNV